ncbi:MAG: hypothetical protein K2O40_03170 [Lachnospiraceae bacterium]|nr:hypothetical protein [Lachnospiraceae bacterium]
MAESESTINDTIAEKYDASTEAFKEENSLELETSTPLKEDTYISISEIELDELQQLYLDFDSSLSYQEAVDYIANTGLPYSEAKNNGSRTLQVAFTEGCTAQKYMKESGDYLTITYRYPRNENSSNDILDKYTFDTCVYVPLHSALTLTHAETINYISRLGTVLELDSSMTREEQMLYYFNNQ